MKHIYQIKVHTGGWSYKDCEGIYSCLKNALKATRMYSHLPLQIVKKPLNSLKEGTIVWELPKDNDYED